MGLHIYVMLSRVRTAQQVLIFGSLPPVSLFQRGPPAYLTAALSRLQGLADEFSVHVEKAKKNLRWTMDRGSASVDEVSSAHVVSSGAASVPAAPALLSRQDVSSVGSSALDEVSLACPSSTAQGMASVPSASSRTCESDRGSVNRGSKRAGDASLQLPPRKHVVVSLPSGQSSGSPLIAPLASHATGKPLRYRSLNICYSSRTAKLIPGEVRAVSSESCYQGVDLCDLLYDCSADEVRQCAAILEDTRGAGLKNLGSTCFVSAVIQCLVNVKAYSQLMLAHSRMCPIGPDDCVRCALAQSY